MSHPSKSTIVVLFILLFYGANLSGAQLPKLTDPMKVCSTVLYSDETKMEQFKVDEFVDQREQSIRLDVLNVAAGKKDDASNKAIYFKLLSRQDASQPGQETPDPDESKRLVMYDQTAGRCRESHTSEWKLQELTRLLSRLMDPEFQLSKEAYDSHSPLAIGPFGLLKLVYENANMFVLDSQSHDELTLADNYHFSLKLNNFWDTKRRNKGRLVATMTIVRETQEKERISLTVGTSRLSDVLIEPIYLSSIAIVVLRDDKLATVDEYNSLALLEAIIYNNLNGLVGGTIVAYELFNECLLTKRLEHRDTGDDVKDPFLMPTGSGCGKLMNNNHPYYMKPRQFSGQFEATDFNGKYYAAYDELSNHFRYDLVGEHKLIYALDSKLVTFVAADSVPSDDRALRAQEQEQKAGKTVEKSRYLSHTHCAQTEVQDERIFCWPDKTWSPWSGISGVADILGIGHNAGLMYLGKTTLASSSGGESSDPLTCHVFEREITLAELPLLVYAHVRVVPSERNRLFLVYYLVDELGTLTRATLRGAIDSSPVPSMWLKRVELVSLSDMSKYSFMNAQFTFNKFSWSLETVGEDTRNRQLQLAHPVRAFDLAECWPESSQYQLDLVLKRAQLPQPELHSSAPEVGLSLEDTLISGLARRISFMRSHISDFLVQDFTQQQQQQHVNIGDQDENDNTPPPAPTLLIESKLTFPLSYNYKTELLGWLETVEPLQHKRQVQMVEKRLLNLVHECTLSLATQFAGENRFHMLFCPKVGCGRLLVSIKELEESSKSSYQGQTGNLRLFGPGVSRNYGSMIHVYYNMCELHLVRKEVHLPGLVSKAERVDVVQGELAKPDALVESLYQITKVALESGSSQLAAAGRDQVVVAGFCYTDKTVVLRDSEPLVKILGEHELRLAFLRHHQSRVQCHKACLMYNYCETYSYDHASRECVLANIRPDTLNQDMGVTLAGTKASSSNKTEDCAIYSIDQLANFRRTSEIVPQTPANFFDCAHETAGVVLAGVELSKCASLCHSVDWSMRTGRGRRPPPASGDAPVNSLSTIDEGCRQFSYMHLRSLCKFRVPDRVEFLSLFRVDAKLRAHTTAMALISSYGELENYLAATGRGHTRAAAYELEAMDTYERDLGQYYSMERNSFVDVTRPLVKPSNDTTGDGSGPAKLVRERYFFHDCMRECTLSPCYAFDFCSDYSVRMHVGTCYLYSIRSPLSIEALRVIRRQPGYLGKWPKLKMQPPQEAGQVNMHRNQLTSLEQLFYYEGKSSRHEVLVKSNDRCEHHYLAGDYLHIKRSLVEAVGAAGGDSLYPAPSVEQQRQQQSGERGQADVEPASAGFGVLIVQLAVGLTIGFAMFIVMPSVTGTFAGPLQWCKFGSPNGGPTLSARLQARFASRPKETRLVSESRLEVHEMTDIDRR